LLLRYRAQPAKNQPLDIHLSRFAGKSRTGCAIIQNFRAKRGK